MPKIIEPYPTLFDLWGRWKRISDQFPQRPNETFDDTEQRQNQLTAKEAVIEREILRTPARTIADVLVKLRLGDAVVRQKLAFGDVIDEEELEVSDLLLMAAYADLKRLTVFTGSTHKMDRGRGGQK